MSRPQFGRWEAVYDTRGGVYRIARAGARPSAGALARTCPSTGRTPAQDLANARLMAAAPDLYAALLTIVEQWPGCTVVGPDCTCIGCTGWRALEKAAPR